MLVISVIKKILIVSYDIMIYYEIEIKHIRYSDLLNDEVHLKPITYEIVFNEFIVIFDICRSVNRKFEVSRVYINFSHCNI